jgi:hypothetical protein
MAVFGPGEYEGAERPSMSAGTADVSNKSKAKMEGFAA